MKTLTKLVAGAFLLLAFTGCTDKSGATRALKQQGYTDITITGYNIMRCDKNDNFSTGFKAKSASGHGVTGTVCSGIFKGHTIRTH